MIQSSLNDYKMLLLGLEIAIALVGTGCFAYVVEKRQKQSYDHMIRDFDQNTCK